MTPRKIRLWRTIYFACFAVVAAFPPLYFFYAFVGHEISAAGAAIVYTAFGGLAMSSSLLLREEPRLARRGMGCLGFFLLFCILGGLFLGPISG